MTPSQSYKIAFRKIGAPFLAISAVWILASDWFVHHYPSAIHLELNLGKGLAFVLFVSLLATLLGGRMLKRAARAEQGHRQGVADRQALYEALPGPVFTLDLQTRVTSWNRHFLDRTGLRPEQVEGQPAEIFVAPDDRDAVAGAIAAILAKGETRTVEAGLLTADGRTLPYLLSGSPQRDESGAVVGVVGFGLDHAAERDKRTTLRKHLLEIESMLDETIRAIGTAIAARDPYTAGHQVRVTRLARAIAERLGLDADRVRGVELAARVHDIGKIAIPADLLNLPRALTTYEREIIQGHAQWGHRILKDIPFSQPVAKIVLQHHERLDGSGYPAGLKGEEILLEARIVAVADIVEAMTAHRPHRPAFSMEDTLEHLRTERGRRLDADVVDACLGVHAEGFTFGIDREEA